MNIKKQYINKLLIVFEIAFILIFPVLFLNLFVGKGLFYHQSYKTLFALLFCVRIILIFHLLALVLKSFYYKVIKSKVAVKNANRKLLFITIISLSLFFEIIFSFVPQSQGNTYYGLAQYIWHIYHGGPLNQMGYRDQKMKELYPEGPKKVFFLGDSFTYGSGIEKIKDRYTNIVAAQLPDKKYICFNLGRGGSDTKDEYLRLRNYPVKPDMVVFQYYFNDIEPAAKEFGYFKEENGSALFSLLTLPVRCSFFLNFIATNSLSFIPFFPEGAYRQEVNNAFNDKSCLNAHLKDFENILFYCRNNYIQLHVLLMPDLTDIEFSESVCFSKIKPLLDENKIIYISLKEELEKYPAEKLIVNKLDNHANEFTQQIIAKKVMHSITDIK